MLLPQVEILFVLEQTSFLMVKVSRIPTKKNNGNLSQLGEYPSYSDLLTFWIIVQRGISWLSQFRFRPNELPINGLLILLLMTIWRQEFFSPTQNTSRVVSEILIRKGKGWFGPHQLNIPLKRRATADRGMRVAIHRFSWDLSICYHCVSPPTSSKP